MEAVSDQAIKQIFTEARTYSAWELKDVSDKILHEIYELMKWGPTSANSSPVRIVFVKSQHEKEKLLSAVLPQNAEKVQTAPVTAIIAQDEKFYEHIPKLAPHLASFKEFFASNKEFADSTALRNSSLQGAYFILVARALGLDCGPMSGFNSAKVDEVFFKGTSWKANFICNIGYGDRTKLHPRLPRLSFEETCKII